ncbi:MAG: 3-isopropylmalate dehydrogenase, partial [Chloroflexi bacterium]|nr:3-isopropylmalate dehydrogenase [Chloroflexota bacterium]
VEVVAEGVRVLEALARSAGHAFHFSRADIGGCAIDKYGTALPPQALALAQQSDAVLFGAVGGPKWDDPKAKVRPEDGILGLRKGLGLFANIRPVHVYPELVSASPVKPALLRGVDMVIIRELTGGLYFGKPKRRWQTSRGRRGVDTMAYSESEVVRILKVGFELARGRRKKLTSVDKANVLESSRLWREIALEMARDYPDVALEHMLVDTAAMQLVRNPARFDVIVSENTFGDILTDEAAVLAGSMGMLPSASLAGAPAPGKRAFGLYEPIHGSAPDIAGKGIANPLATILSVAMMARYSLGLEREAQAVEGAVVRVITEGYRTADIAAEGDRVLGTAQMGDLVAGLV